MTVNTENLEYLARHGVSIGADPNLLIDEYLWFVRQAIKEQPRNQQKCIGPSGVNHPCARRVGYELLEVEPVNEQDGWLPSIGTAYHEFLSKVFSGPHTAGRFLVEQRVDVGEIGGEPVTGSCDAYDTATATVIDHKLVGSTLKGYKAHGPGQQYRGQIHLYGRGWQRARYPVDQVMIAFLPRNGSLDQAYFWHEKYDEQIAVQALQRAEGINLAVTALGTDALSQLPTADAYCTRCPFYKKDSTNLAAGCPGDPSRDNNTTARAFQDLVA